MTRLRRVVRAIGLLVTLVCCFALPLFAQNSPLRIIRRTPADSGTAGTIITVTFDRPVAGMLNSSIDPRRALTITPAIPGITEWRDPTTVRFVPKDPLVPGSTYSVAVDTAAIASNGKRSGNLYRFEARIPGATPLAHDASQPGCCGLPPLGPMPVLRVLYSAPVNLDSVEAMSRLEFTPPCKGPIALRAIRQRPFGRNESYSLASSRGGDDDTVAYRFQRIVELSPRDSLPPECSGRWHIAAFDHQRAADTWSYPFYTARQLRVHEVQPCLWNASDNMQQVCDPDGLQIVFTNAIRTENLARLIHISPPLPPPLLGGESVSTVRYQTRLEPRTNYTVTIDSAVRDIYGRRITGPLQFTLRSRDRAPGVKQQNGLATIPRDSSGTPLISVRVVNVDTLTMLVRPIPDSLMAVLLSTSEYMRVSLLSLLEPALRDTIRVSIPVKARFNAETTLVVRLPKELLGPGAATFSSVRFDIGARSIAADSAALRAARRAAMEAANDSVARVALAAARQGGARPSSFSRIPTLPTIQIVGRGVVDLGLIVQVSDIAAHSKVSVDRGALYVTDRSGAPLADAAVTLYGAAHVPIARGASGADGLALLNPMAKFAPAAASPVKRNPELDAFRYIEVSKGAERLVLPVVSNIPTTTRARLDAWMLGGGYGGMKILRGTVTTDRDIYRPGEMIYAKAYVRYGLFGDVSTLTGDSVRILITGSDTLRMRTTTLGEFGSAVDSITIPAGVRLGYYAVSAQVRSDGVWVSAGDAYVRVAEFRAPDFLVRLVPDSAPRFFGDTVTASLNADYLFGAPMSRAPIDWSATMRPAQPWQLNIPGTAGYQVGMSAWWGEHDEEPDSDVVASDSLDAAGHADLRIPVPAALFKRSAMMELSAAIADANNQVVMQTKTKLIHASAYYVAARMRASAWYLKIGTPQIVDAFVVRPGGGRVAGVSLRVTIVRHQWVLDNGPDGPSGGYHFVADTVERLAATSSMDSVPIQFTPAKDGAYDVRIEVVDEKGRASVTNLGRWAFTSGWYSEPRSDALRLRVTTQGDTARQFALGDTALVSFESPYDEADAWVTLEREAILEQRVIRVRRGESVLRVPVNTKHAPNIWIGVTLIRRGSEMVRGTDSLAAEFRVGYGRINVDSTAHMLRLQITTDKQPLRPGDSARVHVAVTDVSDKRSARPVRAEVAIWAVDEGVLSLTNYRTPDILKAISASNGVGSSFRTTLTMLPWLNATGDVRPGVNVPRFGFEASGTRAPFSIGQAGANAVIQIRNPLMLTATVTTDSVGSDDSVTPIPIRQDFRFVAFYIGSAVTDDAGNATVQAKLSDNITTFRLMATAMTTGHRYGSGESELLVTRNIVVRPALPRFARHGDEVSVSAIVNLHDLDSAKLKVTFTATNADVLRGGAAQEVVATNLKGAEPRFSIKLPPKSEADVTRLRFVARDSATGDGDAIETVLPIRPVGSPRSHTAIGVVHGSGTVSLALPGDIDPERSTVTFALGSSPIVAMRTQYEKLRAYPYYCTEQIVTAARALLALNSAERVLGDSTMITHDSISVMQDVRRAVNEVARRQMWDGHFLYFPGSHWIEGPWMTAYVGTFLLEAERAGVRVPRNVIDASVRRLNADINDPLVWDRDTISGAPWERRARARRLHGDRIVVARFLRDAGSPAVRVENDLISRAADLSWEDRVVLAELLSRRTEGDARARAMLTDAWRVLNVAGKRIEIPDSLRGSAPFPSHIRPAARLLTATMRIDPRHALIGALAETLIQQGAAERNWTWNTQDYGSAVGALASYVTSQRSASGMRVVLRSHKGDVLMSRAIATTSASGDSVISLRGLVQRGEKGSTRLTLEVSTEADGGSVGSVSRKGDAGAESIMTPLYYAVTVNEVSRKPPVTPNIAGISIERWYERFEDGTPVTSVTEGDLVRVRLRITVPADRQFVAIEDLLPAGLEAVDLSLRTSGSLGPFVKRNMEQNPALSRQQSAGPIWQSVLYGSWDGGWWSPWEYKEMRDDRVLYFARQLWTGTYHSSYVARATTAGTFIRPPAQAVEMYNPAVQGRSDGGVFVVRVR